MMASWPAQGKALLWLGLCLVLSLSRTGAAPVDTRFTALRPALESLLDMPATQGVFSVYVEDLATGTALGIREDKRYPAWSLLKVAVMGTVLKEVEKGALDLYKRAILTEKDISMPSTFETKWQAGQAVPLRELLVRMIALSDNVASTALGRYFTASAFQAALEGLGLPVAPPDKPRNTLPQVSARDFAAALRHFSRATFVSRELSDVALHALSATAYASQIPADLPGDVAVAHMVGFNAQTGHFHDCGIVALPGRPYILCVMSRDTTRPVADEMIRRISATVYAHLSLKGASG